MNPSYGSFNVYIHRQDVRMYRAYTRPDVECVPKVLAEVWPEPIGGVDQHLIMAYRIMTIILFISDGISISPC